MALLGAAKQAVKASSDAGLLSPGIRAYHGSPHDFDRFSTDFGFSGEGAQAYGPGLYFAESEKVARSYRDSLASKRPNPTYKGKNYGQLDGPEYRALSYIERELRFNKNLSVEQAKDQAITSLNLRKQRASETVSPERR